MLSDNGHRTILKCEDLSKPRCKVKPQEVVYRWDGKQELMCTTHAKLNLKRGYTRWLLPVYPK
jgi:hypothetical protein